MAYRVLVNALSVTNRSGVHVLAGHVGRLADDLKGRCRFVVLAREDSIELRGQLSTRVDWLAAPRATARWGPRAAWERVQLRQAARRCGARAYFTPSGMSAAGLGIPQVVFCQNPWALEPAARRPRDAIKAWLQRRAYRGAMQRAVVMVFNSRYMQRAYRQAAGCMERRGRVVYQAADDETHARAKEWRAADRKAGQIVCVSVMGAHKNVEALVRALPRVRAQGHPEAELHLIGPWPDRAYKRRIRLLVGNLSLESAVHFAGFVPRERLDRYYAEARVYALMSRCESFGIPAIEAQCFGTPVVCSNICAVPEVCGAGGWFCDPDDIDGIAANMVRALGDDREWAHKSEQARRNAACYTWIRCSQPLVDLFAELCGSYS